MSFHQPCTPVDDSEFPDVRELLQPYNNLAPGPASVNSVASVPMGRSYFSVRATTFDGKTVVIRKKPKKFIMPAVRGLVHSYPYHCNKPFYYVLDIRCAS